MRPVPEREAAKVAGGQFYWTGKACRNGHIDRRYTSNGMCVTCQSEKDARHKPRKGQHPNRMAAREAGEMYYSTGKPCPRGHDRRLVSNGGCAECQVARVKKYHNSHPGLMAEQARRYRAKDPTSHRKASSKWVKNNPGKSKIYRQRTFDSNPELWRKRQVAYTRNYMARKATNGGIFTDADIDALFIRQDGKCTGCHQAKKLEVDHIIAVSKGGSNDPSNLQLLCRSCNASKCNKDMAEWLHEKFPDGQTTVASVINI